MGDFAGVLRSGAGVPADATYLAFDPVTALWGRLPARADLPVLTVEPGAEVVIDTVSHEGMAADQGADPLTFFAEHGVAPESVLAEQVELAATRSRADGDGPHLITGPIEVRGAQPGDVLAMTLVDATPRVPYGVISNRHGRGALPGEYPAGGADVVSVFAPIEADAGGTWSARLARRDGGPRDVHVPLAPFLGIMGVAADADERPHSVPPGAFGGNLDIKELTAGSTVYLPVQVPGALAYVGDPHFAQGDGEVALTALEASLRVTVRFDLVPASAARRAFGELTGPLGETADYLLPTGLDADLGEAVRKATRAAIALLGAKYSMEPHLALAYLSAGTDLRVSQVVDDVCGAHAMIRKADFEVRRA